MPAVPTPPPVPPLEDGGSRPRIALRAMTHTDVARVREIEVAAYEDAWPATTFESELRNGFASYLVASEFAPNEEPAAPLERPRAWPLRWIAGPAIQVPGRVVGYCGAWFTVDQLHIVTIAVDPAEQGRGIAQALLLECFERASAAELRNVALEVRPSNARALALYERFGFKPRGRLRGYYKNNGEDAIVMLTEDLDTPSMRERLANGRAEHGRRFGGIDWCVLAEGPAVAEH